MLCKIINDCMVLFNIHNVAIRTHCKSPGFHTGFFGGEGRSLWGSVCRYVRACSTHALACVEARGVWGHAPPQEKFFLDLLRLLLT